MYSRTIKLINSTHTIGVVVYVGVRTQTGVEVAHEGSYVLRPGITKVVIPRKEIFWK